MADILENQSFEIFIFRTKRGVKTAKELILGYFRELSLRFREKQNLSDLKLKKVDIYAASLLMVLRNKTISPTGSFDFLSNGQT